MNVELELRALQLRVITLEAQVAAHERSRKDQWGAIIASTIMALAALGTAFVRG